MPSDSGSEESYHIIAHGQPRKNKGTGAHQDTNFETLTQPERIVAIYRKVYQQRLAIKPLQRYQSTPYNYVKSHDLLLKK